jgi:hypothetical protein
MDGWVALLAIHVCCVAWVSLDLVIKYLQLVKCTEPVVMLRSRSRLGRPRLQLHAWYSCDQVQNVFFCHVWYRGVHNTTSLLGAHNTTSMLGAKSRLRILVNMDWFELVKKNQYQDDGGERAKDAPEYL